MNTPAYINLLNNGILEDRVHKLKSMLQDCVLCPHQCKVNRLRGERGYCKTLENPIVSGAEPHFGEEDELVGRNGSGTIFFSHCNMSCIFCQNYDISHLGVGQEIDVYELAELMLELQERGCHNINFVTPGHVVPQMVQSIYIAAQGGLSIPIVYNSNGYDLIDTLKMLEGIIDIYMPDIKFASNQAGLKYLGVKNYYDIAKSAVKEMYRQVGNLMSDSSNIAYKGLLVRHLVMPQNVEHTKKILEFISDEISKDAYINLMNQYYPAFKSHNHPEIDRPITTEEYVTASNYAKQSKLSNYRTAF